MERERQLAELQALHAIYEDITSTHDVTRRVLQEVCALSCVDEETRFQFSIGLEGGLRLAVEVWSPTESTVLAAVSKWCEIRMPMLMSMQLPPRYPAEAAIVEASKAGEPVNVRVTVCERLCTRHV